MNRIVVSIAAGVTTVLVVFAGGYGYHRDELYFLAAGRHLAWAYADQGPFTPLVARAMSEIAPDSLTVLRIPSALTAGATVYAYGDWGPPPNGSAPVVAVGLPLADLARLRGCRVVARIDDGLGTDNDEQGTHVDVCRGPVRPWSQEWPALRHLG